MENSSSAPMLFPVEPEAFWNQMRLLVREEIAKTQSGLITSTSFQTQGLVYKPLYKIREVCSLLQVTRPTLYEWIKEGRLKPYKIKSRVYFLYNDIIKILTPAVSG